MTTVFHKFGYRGDECFCIGKQTLSLSLLDFWRWSGSNLLDNTMRGMLAEYLVAAAIGAQETVRQEWSAWDLTTPSGAKIEVKSAAYLQNWHQEKPSAIRFGIQPTQGWDDATGKYDRELRRQADYYVFCLFTPKKKSAADPLQLEQWTFYPLAARILNQQCKNQKTIGLTRILELGARQHTWSSLKHRIWSDADALNLVRESIRCKIKKYNPVGEHGVVIEFASEDSNTMLSLEFDYQHNHVYFEVLDLTGYTDGEFITLDSSRRKCVISESFVGNAEAVLCRINDVLQGNNADFQR